MSEYKGPERRKHHCIQEVNIALMKDHIEDSTKAWIRIEKKLNNGMSTQVELNKTSIVRVWWFIGVLSVCLISATVKIIVTGG